MPESTRDLTPDPPLPPPEGNVLPSARPVRRGGVKPVTEQVFDDSLIAQLLAQEAATMASIGHLPEEAPAPSPGLPTSILDTWAACEKRLEANGVGGMLSMQERRGNTRDLCFYPSTAHGITRRGLWLAEGCAGASHYLNTSLATLAENTRQLTDLEDLLGVQDVRASLLLAGTEHLLRQHGIL